MVAPAGPSVTCDARPRAIEDLLRELAPQVLGAVVRRYGDFDAAEDAVQEALLAAAQHWPADGLPDNPRGWLIQTAVRRLIDQYRSDEARRRREESAALREVPGAEPVAARRHADAAVHVLPSRADARVRDRADAARGRRPDHRRDRDGVPGAGGDDGAADQPGQAADQGLRRPFRMPDAAGVDDAAAVRAARAVPDVQRGLRQQQRRRAAAHRPVRRGDPADPDGAPDAARERRGRPGCWR